MANFTKKHGGWADDFKKDKTNKKSILESFEKERIIKTSSSLDDLDDPKIPEIDDIEIDTEEILEPSAKITYNKELNLEIFKKSSTISPLDGNIDLSILIECLDVDDEGMTEADEVWQWNQLFTQVTAQISNENP